MAIEIQGDFSTRGGFVEAIRAAGLYIADHAGNLLGEYPSALHELTVTANLRFDEPPTIDVRRTHFVCDAASYPQNSADVDTLEKIARDMYREIEEHDARHPDEVPRAHEERRLYGDRLHRLGVAL